MKITSNSWLQYIYGNATVTNLVTIASLRRLASTLRHFRPSPVLVRVATLLLSVSVVVVDLVNVVELRGCARSVLSRTTPASLRDDWRLLRSRSEPSSCGDCCDVSFFGGDVTPFLASANCGLV